MKFFKQKSIAGFTLIEALLYLAIAGTVLYFISGFAFNSLFGKAKIETIQGVNENSLSVLNDIGNTVSGSMGINGLTSPAVSCVATSNGTVTYTDSSGLNPRSSPPYTGGYTVHTFTTNGIFTVSSDSCNVQALVVAGGGGGAALSGGGAGGLIYYGPQSPNAGSGYTVMNGSLNIVVGNGGTQNNNGQNSSFGSLIAIGGGGGNSASGGSGAGGCGGSNPPGYGTAGQGNNGLSVTDGGYNYCGGGGGAGAAGGPTAQGGIGLQYSISGTSTYYAGGGSGGNSSGSVPGGLGGGGASGAYYHPPFQATAGTSNTGGGGGGEWPDRSSPVSGGSGIVIVRYLTAN